ncbi:Protein serine/threonine phosphatase OS=Streptomyces glaucescens OX=1907 GN=SGLAU_02320 PE=4 SV=1 [Streptomyces glaucescens]
MGTTVAGVVVRHDALLVFNVGDSRVHAASPEGLRRLSVDDSPPLEPGRRTTSIVTQCLGGSPATAPSARMSTPVPWRPATVSSSAPTASPTR